MENSKDKSICNYWKTIVEGIVKGAFSLNFNNNNNNNNVVLALKMVLCKGDRRSWTHNVCGEKIRRKGNSKERWRWETKKEIFNLYEYGTKDDSFCHSIGMRGKDDGKQKVIREKRRFIK